MEKRYTSNKPFPMNDSWIRASPFKDRSSALNMERRYKNGESIGFTALASLRSMGRLPRVHGRYIIGEKYRHLKFN